MKKAFSSILFVLVPIFSFCQTTEIAGIINAYTSVTAISGSDLTVGSTEDFSIGDLVLIMQMQGATLNETNTPAFGDVSALNNAGNYEYATVCSISGPNSISLLTLHREYDIEGVVQLIKVPVYTNAVVISELTAEPWNGTTGGVLAFNCSGTLTMNDGINMQGMGFRGGDISTSVFSCAWYLVPADYFYDIASGEGAKKGEGIGQYIAGKTGGRGPQTSGGGGGNDHNSGGGGGANAGAGGSGGERIPSGVFSCSGTSPGIGGKFNTFSNADNKVFLGGAGGSGHENNAGLSTRGSNGGGIVMIKATTVIGNAETINVNGQDIAIDAADGAGGGGAGGSVLLDVASYSGTLNINAKGANGGNVSNLGSSNCNGPGGGGGGGLLWINQATLPAEIILTITGGASGTTLASAQPGCTIGGNNDAQNGNAGVLITDLVFSESFCSIPVNVLNANICNGDSLFLEGAWQNTDGVYLDTIFTGCCDSIVETTLIINPSSTGVDMQSACDSLTWLDGVTYTASNTTATHTLSNEFGCDSVVTLNLTISDVDISITNEDPSIIANATGATFRWLNCDNGYSLIPGETDPEFSPTANGNYAVEVTQNGCVDTSECTTISTIDLADMNAFTGVRIYPNPSAGIVNIDLEELTDVTISISDMLGRTIIKQQGIKGNNQFFINRPSGVYLVDIEWNGLNYKHKLIIE